MIKLYEKIKAFIKNNYKFLIMYIVVLIVCLYPLPYYIYTGGGIINLDEDEYFKYLEISKKVLSGTIGNNILELNFPLDENLINEMVEEVYNLVETIRIIGIFLFI